MKKVIDCFSWPHLSALNSIWKLLLFVRMLLYYLYFVAYLLQWNLFCARHMAKPIEISAPKGKFLIHMLHSAYFFPQTVDVKWSASAQGKPNLPVWLHLFPSKHKPISYLIGTPVTPFQQITIHVIAKRLDSYKSAEQLITILFNEDVRYNSSTQQIAELKIKNIEAEDFTNLRNDHIRQLEKAIHETFRGKGVNPYIFNIAPEIENPPEEFYRMANRLKIGSIVQIGTQQHFHANVHRILEGLRHFRPFFTIDWCGFDIKNMTMIKLLGYPSSHSKHIDTLEKQGAKSVQMQKAEIKRNLNEADNYTNYPHPPVNYFWQSILVFPSLAVFCILLILFLSFIFFGRREGQHWRDYTTSKEQLQEYLNVRESQRHLREMSVQRQMLKMSSSIERKSMTPLGINVFLQPKNCSLPPPSPVPALHALQNGHSGMASQRSLTSSSQPRLPTSASTSPALHRSDLKNRANSNALDNKGNESQAMLQNHMPRTHRPSSVGKQTVADAARATNSSLHLYRNPLDDEDLDREDLLHQHPTKCNEKANKLY